MYILSHPITGTPPGSTLLALTCQSPQCLHREHGPLVVCLRLVWPQQGQLQGREAVRCGGNWRRQRTRLGIAACTTTRFSRLSATRSRGLLLCRLLLLLLWEGEGQGWWRTAFLALLTLLLNSGVIPAQPYMGRCKVCVRALDAYAHPHPHTCRECTCEEGWEDTYRSATVSWMYGNC
jgi:hypothetical protein